MDMGLPAKINPGQVLTPTADTGLLPPARFLFLSGSEGNTNTTDAVPPQCSLHVKTNKGPKMQFDPV